MRVICIEDSIIVDKDEPNFRGIAAHKGCVYHVINSIDGKVLREIRNINYALGAWYEFLEIPRFLHHHVRFLEIPEDDIEIEQNSQVAQMDDGQRGDNINRMKVYRFESCPDY